MKNKLQNKIQTILAKKNAKKRFTLIEMLIVVFIIAALVAIFVPTFGVFHKADGTSLNANAKNVETAVFQYQMANKGEMPVADKDGIDGITSADAVDMSDVSGSANQFDEINAVLTQALTDAMGTAPTTAFLEEFKAEALFEIKEDAKKYVKGSGFNLDEFYIVGDKLNIAGYNQELAGFIFSERTVVDSDGVIYNGTVTVK